MNSRPACPFRRLPILGALALCLALAACGLKGPLDLPPASTPPGQTQLDGVPSAEPSDSEHQPLPSEPRRKRIFLDVLLD